MAGLHQQAQIQLTDEQIAEFAEIFKLWDKDGSGFIDIHELSKMLTYGFNENWSISPCMAAVHASESARQCAMQMETMQGP